MEKGRIFSILRFPFYPFNKPSIPPMYPPPTPYYLKCLHVTVHWNRNTYGKRQYADRQDSSLHNYFYYTGFFTIDCSKIQVCSSCLLCPAGWLSYMDIPDQPKPKFSREAYFLLQLYGRSHRAINGKTITLVKSHSTFYLLVTIFFFTKARKCYQL